MISIVDAAELENVLRPTVYRPSSAIERELVVRPEALADVGPNRRTPGVRDNKSLDARRWTLDERADF